MNEDFSQTYYSSIHYSELALNNMVPCI